MSWREDETRNESRSRNRNEWIDKASLSFGERRLTTFVCECGDASCTRSILLTKPEYEVVRSGSTHFALALNHENPEAETVIGEYPRYAVVDKVDPDARRIALETNPRFGPQGDR
jgi:hypothetical protein